MNSEHVHFYSANDLSVYTNIETMEKVVKAYEEGRQPVSINDYLEMYHIVQFVEHGKYPHDWDENKIAAIKQFNGKVAAYFSHLQSNGLPVIFGEIERGYESTIWQIIDQFKIKGLITEEGLREILKDDTCRLRELLMFRWVVENNNGLLTQLLKENANTAEWLLDQYVAYDKFGNNTTLFFPKSLSLQDKDEIIHRYVNSDDANLNYVRLVLQAKRSSEFSLSPQTIKDARIRETKLNEEVLKNGCVHVTRYGVTLTDKLDAPVKKLQKKEDGSSLFVYNKNLIDACQYSSIIYYCGKVFEFTDEYGFISLISKMSDAHTLEWAVGLMAKNAYFITSVFGIGENIAHLQMQVLEAALKDTSRSIEGAIKFFYEDFLKSDYGYQGFSLTLPKNDDDLILKIRSLVIEMDSVAHQYNCYVKHGSIDQDIIELEVPCKITETKSLISRRYCVQNKNNNEVWYLIRLFFGSQSMLHYVEPCKDMHLRNFYALLKKGIEVKYNSYKFYQKQDIDYLIKNGYLSIDEHGFLRCDKMQEIKILKHLYEYGACSYWRYPKEERAILDEMVSKGWIEYDNHLLSPAERDYFSYYLNNEKFTNGPAIRNNYAHGTTPSYSEEKHLHNYLQILVLFIMLLLKISEDLDMKRFLDNNRFDNK